MKKYKFDHDSIYKQINKFFKNMLLKNKTVIITGSSRGIGSDIATLFAKEGANLVLNYRQDYTAASRLKDNLLQYNNNIEVFKADITQRNDKNNCSTKQ